jgi:DNA-binding response OmpR family regulator
MEKAPIKIMLVEEEEFVQQAYSFFLKREGFEVIIVPDGREVLPTIKKENPSLVLLDLVLPGMHGFEVLEELRKKGISKKIPIIIISNLGQDSDIEKCYNLGATDYLIKSNYFMREVIQRVKFHLHL